MTYKPLLTGILLLPLLMPMRPLPRRRPTRRPLCPSRIPMPAPLQTRAPRPRAPRRPRKKPQNRIACRAVAVSPVAVQGALADVELHVFLLAVRVIVQVHCLRGLFADQHFVQRAMFAELAAGDVGMVRDFMATPADDVLGIQSVALAPFPYCQRAFRPQCRAARGPDKPLYCSVITGRFSFRARHDNLTPDIGAGAE